MPDSSISLTPHIQVINPSCWLHLKVYPESTKSHHYYFGLSHQPLKAVQKTLLNLSQIQLPCFEDSLLTP